MPLWFLVIVSIKLTKELNIMKRKVQQLFSFTPANKRETAVKVATLPLSSTAQPVSVEKLKLPPFTAQQFAVDNEGPSPQIQLTIAQWYNVTRNPYQKETRDTARDISHLYRFIKEHATVKMGVYPDGKVCKIDGHTRGRLYYERPELVDRVPKFLAVECFPVRDDAHASQRFIVADNSKTAKNAADDVHGALRLAGVTMKSKFCCNATNIKTALGYAYEVWYKATFNETVKIRDVETVIQVKRFKDALLALDRIDVNRGRLKAPFIMAFLLAHKKFSSNLLNLSKSPSSINLFPVLEFFRRINNGNYGVKKGKMMCPIAAIEIESLKHVGGGRATHLKLVVQVLGALATYMQDSNCKSLDYEPAMSMEKVMTVELDKYLLQLNAKRTGRTIEKRR